jgi:hypothetical protein
MDDRLKAAVRAWGGEGGRRITSPVAGESMAPFLRSGDQIDWIPLGPESLRRGDLITFVSRGGLVVHRFLWRRMRGIELQVREKGDSHRLGRWIRGDEVLGRVLTVRRRDRSFDLTHWHWRLANVSLGIAHALLDRIVGLRAAKRRSDVTRRDPEAMPP